MNSRGQTWAVVLAAGEGTRLRSLTDRAGRPTPKQYCSLWGGPSLFAESIRRASRAVPRARIRAVVAAEHRALWESELRQLDPGAFVEQPANRGTAAGVLLPLLGILDRDPRATVLFYPSDHYVADERRLAGTVRRAARAVSDGHAELVLIGIRPDAPETGYGWIQSAVGVGGLRTVTRFVEKPQIELARRLMEEGAAWNSFVFAADGAALLERFRARLPETTRLLAEALAVEPGRRAARLQAAYASLESHDFSRSILTGDEGRLHVAVAPDCGWTDLGTPERVRACLTSALPPPRSSRRQELAVAHSLARLEQLTAV